jgi:hypothetical protein
MQLIEIFSDLTKHCDKFEHYFPLYEKWLSRFVGTAPKILEIGVQFGGSSEMWRKYFGPGTIVHGVDISEDCKSLENEYLKIHIGNQSEEALWQHEFLDQGLCDFDIIFDDGSHENSDQIATLAFTFLRLLRIGGIYWCEDTHTSYYKNVRVRDGGYRNPASFIEHAKRIIDVIHARHTHYAIGHGPTPSGPHVDPNDLALYHSTSGIHFYDSVVIIEKELPASFSRLIQKPSYGINREPPIVYPYSI